MPYVSCMYAPPDPIAGDQNLKEGENARIVCIDENGVEWWLTENSEVGDWLRFKEEGKLVDPYEAPPEAKPAPEEEPPS